MTMPRMESAVVSALLALLLGCGSDGDGGGSRIDLGGDDSQVIEDLDDGEAKTLCESLQNEGDALDVNLSKEQECEASAAVFTADKTACESLRDQCLMAPDSGADDEEDDPEDGDDCSMAGADTAGCKATVGEFEACLNAYIAQFEQLTSLTCAEAGKYDQADFTSAPKACETVMEKCPQLLDSEDDQSGSTGSIRLERTLRKLAR